MAKNLTSMYRTVLTDHFPETMEITFRDTERTQTLFFEKVQWDVEGERRGLRYGENPGQEAVLYKLVNGNLQLGNVTMIEPGRYLSSEIDLLQTGKHPGKTNITDADNALNILRYFQDTQCTVIVKHNNPCGVALDSTLAGSYNKALMADRIAAFGGTIAVNREMDLDTAEMIIQSYSEVVVAPEYAPGVLNRFKTKKNLRVMKIENMKRLQDFIGRRFLDAKSLIDGGMIMQWSYVPSVLSNEDLLPASSTFEGREYRVQREPDTREYSDMVFGWLVESGVTSNSIMYVKDGVTVGIGTGEQDRVGVAEIARDKAYRKYADRLSWETFNMPFSSLEEKERIDEIQTETMKRKGGLVNSVMVSDAFFPFRDGIDVGLKEGVSAVIQPGGSLRDFECIQACNEFNAAMKYTGQRSFKH